MKKRILLIGNDKFMREAYDDGKFVVLPKRKYVDALYESYEIDNISNYELTSKSAISLVECFIKHYDYDICLISFGTNELKNISVENFKKNLQNIVNVLICKGVVPVIMEFNSDSSIDVNPYNQVISDIKAMNKFDNKFYNECMKLVNA